MPDLITTAKAMAGGMPLAAVTGRAELMDAVHVGGLGGTYGGNPVSCAAALAAIGTMVDQDLAGAAAGSAPRSTERFTALQADRSRHRRRPRPGGHDGHGAGAARDPRARPDAARRIVAACHRQGVVTLSCGSFGNVIRLLPPLVIEPELLDDGLGILADAVTAEL